MLSLTTTTTPTRYVGVTDLPPRFGRERLRLWTGAFMSDPVGVAEELPKRDGYMVTVGQYGWVKVRVTCPSPRTNNNYREVDAAIAAAFDVAGYWKD